MEELRLKIIGIPGLVTESTPASGCVSVSVLSTAGNKSLARTSLKKR